MEGYSGTISPPGLYVKALYDYDADDRTSLSFRQGDIIQVLTQLESGWWDGVIDGVRGWFPSNYCVLVVGHEADKLQERARRVIEDQDIEELSEDEYDDPGFQMGLRGSLQDEDTQQKARHSVQKEDAAFWIPQATPDGRLFYFNTLTGVSTMELPLESPTSTNETGPRDRTNIYIPDHTRPPPEMMAGGYEREDDTDYDQSGSETEGLTKLRSSPRKRRSYMSDGVSPATSVDSLTLARSQGDILNPSTSSFFSQQTAPPLGTSHTSFVNSSGSKATPTVSSRFFNDGSAVRLTWSRLTEDMRKSVDRYREAINAGDRAQFVQRAEDISDHLRLLLAAGSGTTDHYSGIPSVISENKELYPRFRDMMSRFSKLVLSSHIAATAWSPAEQASKCLQEADGVLNGVYGFVDVARQQRGEEIPRLFPGFISGSASAGSWQNNGLVSSAPTLSTAFPNRGLDATNDPNTILDTNLLDRMNELKKSITAAIRHLDSQLSLQEKVPTIYKHQSLGNAVCGGCQKVLEQCKPWMATLESVNLSATTPQQPLIGELNERKQRAYGVIAELVLVCQNVTMPLADEWSAVRGESMDERLLAVQKTGRDLEASTSQVNQLLQKLLESIPSLSKPNTLPRSEGIQNGSMITSALLPPASNQASRAFPDRSRSRTPNSGSDPAADLYRNGESSKVKQFFGEVPVMSSARTDGEDIPHYLRLDHEGEIHYDLKHDPPLIKGGTLTGLVEQLTRHDRVNLPFNNTFLLTYQSFTTAPQLFEMILKRWNVQPPFGLTPEEHKGWTDLKQSLIRFRIVNVLKSWFEWFWMEGSEEASKDLMMNILNFAKDTISNSNTPGAVPLMNAINQRLRGQDASAKRLIQTQNVPTPPPILPKNMKKLKFLDIDATEFARQLTIIESRLYSKIKPYECLNKVWQKKVAKNEDAAGGNVKALILHSNQLTNWVAQMILSQQDVKKRAIVIKHFVSVADRCLSFSNFSTLTSIISALGTAPIHRLNRTWTQVNAKTMTTLEKMRRLMGSTKNFAEYREALNAATAPCIPFFGVYLTDLTFIEDGIPSTLKKSELINFAKRAKVAEVIRDIQSYQNVGYPFKSVPELQDYVLSMMQSAGDVHEMYDKSLLVEPREREDEKIARLLSESGFM